jgi:hypothetical protein
MNKSEYMKLFNELPDEEKALTLLWWWNFNRKSKSLANPEIMHERIFLHKDSGALYECSIGLEEYDVYGKGVILYETDYNKREDTTEILVNNIYIEEMIFSTGGPEIKINEKEKMTELMALCFVSGLEKELDAYDVRTTKEYNWRPIKKKYSSLVLNTFPFLFLRSFMDALLGDKKRNI